MASAPAVQQLQSEQSVKHIAAAFAVEGAHCKLAVEGAEEPGKQVVLSADIAEVVPNTQAALVVQLGAAVAAAALVVAVAVVVVLPAVGSIALVDIAVVLTDSFAGTELAVPEAEPVAIVIAEPEVEPAEHNFELELALHMLEPFAEEAG